MGKTDLTLFMARPGDESSFVVRPFGETNLWTVDVLRSPVIELTRCYFDGEKLRRGRLYFVPGYYGPNDKWIEKSQDFMNWALALLKTVRKTLKRPDTGKLCR